MNDEGMPIQSPILPRRLRTYLIINVVTAVFMGIVMAVRSELRTGHYLFIDVALIIVFSSMLAAMTVGPFALVEIYLYRKRKGLWYKWKHAPIKSSPDLATDPGELRRRRKEAIRVRSSRGDRFALAGEDRTCLFEMNFRADPVSRASLLLSVADEFERSGKRAAAERCYRQIVQRFAGSPEAMEAAGRLTSITRT
jgi:hypothetical protein